MNFYLKTIIYLFFLTFSFKLYSQVLVSERDFLQLVVANHPLAKRSQLMLNAADVQVRSAKGSFDAMLFADWSNKNFDGKQYYGLLKSGVRLPTRYGVELKAGYDLANGAYFNPENKVPSKGLGYLGVAAYPLQGLLMDDARAQLLQARLWDNASEVENDLIINDLSQEALMAYWDWSLAHEKNEIYDAAATLAQERLNGVRERFFQGDATAVDTLESLVLLQTRLVESQQTAREYEEAARLMGNFWWETNGKPAFFDAKIYPVKQDNETVAKFFAWMNNNLPDSIASDHPFLLQYSFEQRDLDIQRRLKVEKLKPKLKVEYTFLGEQFNLLQGSSEEGFGLLQNYKWGATFSYPIPNRTAQAAVELNDLKKSQVVLKQQDKQNELNNKLQQYKAQLYLLKAQLELYEKMVANAKRLLEAETEKFKLGDSSIFLLNSRESKYLEAQIKFLEGKWKFETTKIKLLHTIADFNVLQ